MLSGCSPDSPTIKPGTCLAKEATANGRRAPDLTSVVPCTSPHRYEVYDVLDLSERTVTAAQAQSRCTTSLLRVTRYDALKVNGKSAAAGELVPALRGIEAPRYMLMPKLPGEAGHREVVCMARMTVPVQAASDDVLLLSVAKTSAFPVALRPCRAYDAERRRVDNVPCSSRHAAEMLFYFEADRALGKKFTASIVRDPTAEKFDRLDDICTKVLPQLLGNGFDQRLRGFGSVARRWTEESKTVRCDVGPKDFRATDLPPGSLVNSSGKNLKLLAVG